MVIISPVTREERGVSPLILVLRKNIQQFIRGTTVLRGLKTEEMRMPSRAKKEDHILTDGSNIHNVLYNMFLKENRIPEKVVSFISRAFSGTSIRFDLTTDGRCLMKVFENGLELNPPNISDGFYKTLIILVVLETKPSLLVIDELENSLHQELISRIIDELKNVDIKVIVTTHSPAVVDLAKPEDVILIDKDFEGKSILKRIKEPEKIKEKLGELGVTLSEGWL